ncbi:hypothetical protein BGZ81_004074 [Podila clonocystis]|nr:hypothetical protein BGZ81_004074 [Podila clonocystis]
MTETSKPSTTSGATSGGHLTKKQRKEQFEALGALQTQLDVSVSLARNKVASWLSVDGFSDDEEDTKSSKSGNSFVDPSEIKARQPGLGLGAKYISHKDAMRHVPMNAFESKLKRQMTGGLVAAELQRQEQADKNALPDKYQEHKLMMAARRKELQEQQEDEEDSKTRNIGSSASNISASGAALKNQQKKALSAPVHPAAQPPKGGKYQSAVHPAAQKAATHPTASVAASTPKSSGGAGKKRTGDFFSMYMDERAQKMAKKKKKSSAKADPDDD